MLAPSKHMLVYVIMLISGIVLLGVVGVSFANVVMRPETGIQLDGAKFSDPVSHDDGGDKLKVHPITLVRRENTINGISDVGLTNPLDDNGRYVGLYSNRCRETLLMSPIRLEKLLELNPDIIESGGHTCHWEVIGSGACIPQISCTNFTLMDPHPKNGTEPQSCTEEEYLQLWDGTTGLQRYCGKDGPTRITSGRFLRDIYVTLKIAAHRVNNRQLLCSITCIPGNNTASASVKSLTEVLEEHKINPSCTCGKMENYTGVGEVTRGEFPWIAALVVKGTRKPFCTATLINENFVLTSAHCFRGGYANSSNVEVLLHPHELNITKAVAKMHGVPHQLWSADELKQKDEADQSFRFGISRYYIHPLFVRQTNDFDVALVKLDKPVEWNLMSGLSPVCLPDPGQYDQNKEGSAALVAGWGLKEQARAMKNITSQLKVLGKQWVEVYPNTECNKIYDWRFTRRMMCAGHRPKDAPENNCAADMGSGLVAVKYKNIYEQIGILAYGEGCINKKGPGIYTDTRQVSQWIYYICSSESAVWCAGG